MEFTGERLILTPGSRWFWDQLALEHVARYMFARPFAQGRVVLDAACGTGYGAGVLGETATSVTGLDISPDTVAFAEASWGRGNIRFAVGDVNDMPLGSESVDLVVSFETLEHVPDPNAFAAEVHRVLRRKGLFIVSTPNRDVYNWADHQADGGNHFHVSEMSAEEFIAFLSARFEVRHVFGQRLVQGYGEQAILPGEPRLATKGMRGSLAWRTVKALTGPILSRPRIARRALPILRSNFVPQTLTPDSWKYVIAVCEKR